MGTVKVERRKPGKVAYIEHVGDYRSIPFAEDIQALYGWAKESGVRPGFYPLGIFHDRPGDTPPEKCRSEIAIPIYGSAKAKGPVKVRNLPGMKVAALSFRGPASGYPEAYRALSAWVEQHGYAWDGPSIEVYTRKPKQVGRETILYAKIEAPLRKK